MNEWISCKDRMPEKLVDVLVVRRSRRAAVMCYADQGVTYSDGRSGTETIWALEGQEMKGDEVPTHWRELPAPPAPY